VFYVEPELAKVGGRAGGVSLEKSEVNTLIHSGLTLLKVSENSTTLPINGVANVKAFSVTLTYTNKQGTSVDSLLWTDRGKG
jgi:hypothetical protein